MSPGDLIQVDEEGDGIINHSAIVVRRTPYNMYYAQHTPNSRNRSYRYRRTLYPHGRWYLWHYTYGS